MATRKRRKPNQKEPVGDTKSSIIVHISEKGEATITDIREYLRSEKNIRNIKVIRKHLSDLVSEKVISVKKAESRGLSDIYYIEKSFSSFKIAFNFLNNFYKPLFLRTKYAKGVIFSDDFLIYEILNIAIELYKDLIQLKDDNKFNEKIEKAKRNGEDVSRIDLERIKETIKSMLPTELDSEIIEYSLKTITSDDWLDLIGSLTNITTSNLKKNLNIVISSIFPEKQKNEMLQIISSSPMAMDYFLNLKSDDRIYLFLMVMGFYLVPLFKDKNKISIINQFNNNNSKSEKDLMPLISSILSIQNILNDNPLLTILRSYFIVDSFNGNIVDNEYSNLVLKEILLPKVSQ